MNLLSTRIPLTASSSARRAAAATATATATTPIRALHAHAPKRANVVPVYGTGPPPEPPVPSAESPDARLAERRKKADLLKRAKDLRSAASAAAGTSSSSWAAGAKEKRAGALKKRFWKDVSVKEVDGAYEVHLDTRPLRHPTTKAIVRIPLSKPHLAHALAIEWDMLVSAQQATRQHLIPLTSLVCRALDIADDDAAAAHPSAGATTPPIRAAIVTSLLRYLDTDSLLCWAPPPDPLSHSHNAAGESLRDLQERAAAAVVGFLSARVWPGVEIEPVLDDHSIVPRRQKPGVREIIQGWITSLEPWDLAGLERGTLAGKSLLSASRLLSEWSEGSAGIAGLERTFGAEEAARACSVEVDWQTSRWGEVEDTHDVEKEDVRRQLGSVILLVSGSGKR